MRILEIEQALSPQLVEALRAEMLAAGGQAATVSGGGPDRAVIGSIRRASVVRVSAPLRDEVESVLGRFTPRIAEHFGRHLSAFEAPVFLSYGPGDYFVAHQDGNTPMVWDDTRFRKVTVVLFLNDQSGDARPGTYRGGSLVLHHPSSGPDGPTALAPAPGSLVAFPAETTHEVLPVTGGVRLTLVAWYRDDGRPFTER